MMVPVPPTKPASTSIRQLSWSAINAGGTTINQENGGLGFWDWKTRPPRKKRSSSIGCVGFRSRCPGVSLELYDNRYDHTSRTARSAHRCPAPSAPAHRRGISTCRRWVAGQDRARRQSRPCECGRPKMPSAIQIYRMRGQREISLETIAAYQEVVDLLAAIAVAPKPLPEDWAYFYLCAKPMPCSAIPFRRQWRPRSASANGRNTYVFLGEPAARRRRDSRCARRRCWPGRLRADYSQTDGSGRRKLPGLDQRAAAGLARRRMPACPLWNTPGQTITRIC